MGWVSPTLIEAEKRVRAVRTMRRFTKEKLALCNGMGGAPSYLAYRGNVYDVTDSFLWQDGLHQALHRAGEDLTSSLAEAPHGADFLNRFPVVGILEAEDEWSGSQ